VDFIEEFLECQSSAHTRRAYRTDLREFFSGESVDAADVQSVQPEAIQSLMRRLHRLGLSLSTQRRRLAALRSFFDWLIQEEEAVLRHNPARSPIVEPLQLSSSSGTRSVLSKSQIEKLIEVANEPPAGLRDRALISTIVYGALRRREVAELKVEDVRPLGRHWVLELSTESDGGYIRIPDSVVETVDEMKEAQGIESGALWRSVSNQNAGEPLSADGIYKAVQRNAKRAGLGSVSIDMLRRSGLQLALEGGADLPMIQAHGRFASTIGAAKVTPEDHRQGTLQNSAVEYIGLEV